MIKKRLPSNLGSKHAVGRVVSSATYWWAVNHITAYTLYCIHGTRLDRHCEECYE